MEDKDNLSPSSNDPKRAKIKGLNIKKQLKSMAELVTEHSETLQSLKDLPSKFDNLMQALTGRANDGGEVDNENKSVDEDIVSNLLNKANKDDENVNGNDGNLIDILNLTQPIQELGPDLQNDVALSINRLYAQKSTKESLDKLKDRYKIPNNCRGMGVPKVNSEIWSLLPQKTRQNDFNQQVQQQSIGLASTIVAKIAETIFATTEPISKTLREELLRMSIDAETVLGHITQDIGQKRRLDIKPVLNKEVAGICTATIAPGEWLFGENMSEQLKTSRATANIVRSTMKPIRRNNRFAPYNQGSRGTFKNHLNWRAPPPQSNRGGGFNQQFRGRSPRRGINNFQPYQNK